MLADDNAKWKRAAGIAAGVAVAVAAIFAASYGCSPSGDSAGGEQSVSQDDSPRLDLAAPPQFVTWINHKGILLPRSGTSGPNSQDSGAPTGWEHSPQGAALAAIQIPIRVAVADDVSWPELLRVAVAPGVGRDAFSVNRVQLSVTGESDPVTRPRIRGYRVTKYSEEAAAVEVVTSYSDQSIASTHIDLVQREGDWKIVLPDTADTKRSAVTIALSTLPNDLVPLEAPQ